MRTCLKRSSAVKVGPDYDVYLLVYRCRIVSGTPSALEVKELAWVERARLREYPILPADAPLVERLVIEGP